jgi:hypothetical protein
VPTAIGPDPGFHLAQAEGIAVEGNRAVVVVDGQGDPELANGGMASTVANGDLRENPPMTTDHGSWADFAAAAPKLADAGAAHLDRLKARHCSPRCGATRPRASIP